MSPNRHLSETNFIMDIYNAVIIFLYMTNLDQFAFKTPSCPQFGQTPDIFLFFIVKAFLENRIIDQICSINFFSKQRLFQ